MDSIHFLVRTGVHAPGPRKNRPIFRPGDLGTRDLTSWAERNRVETLPLGRRLFGTADHSRPPM